MSRRRLISYLVVLAAVLGPTGLAFASWVQAGAGSGLAVSYSLARPTNLVVTQPSPPVVHLAWTAPDGTTLSGFAYSLTRSGGTGRVAGTCTSLTSASVSCDDSGVYAGETYTWTLKSTVQGWSSAPVSSSMTVGAAAATKLAFTTAPQTIQKNVASGTITVQQQDATGNPVMATSPGVSVALSGPTGSTFSPAPTVAIPAGASSTSFTFQNSNNGPWTINASSSGLTTASQIETQATTGGNVSVQSVTSPGAIAAGGSAIFAINVVAGGNFDFRVTSVGGLPSGASSALPTTCTTLAKNATAALSATVDTSSATPGGTSSVLWIVTQYGSKDGSCTTAQQTDQGTGTLSVVGVPSRLAFVQNPTSTQTGVSFSPAVTVAVEDSNFNVVTNSSASVTVSIVNSGANPGGGSLSGTATANAVNGIATFSNLSIDAIGAGYRLGAATSGLIGASSNSFTVYGTVSQLAFTTQPVGGQTSTAFATQPVVTVQDAQGNTVQNSTASIMLTVSTGTPATGGPGTLTCTTNPKNAVAGVASFSGCAIDTYGAGYRLHATTAGVVTAADSNTFTITSPPATATSVALANSNDTTAPFQSTSSTFTPVNGATYLVFAGHVSSAGDSATVSVTGGLSVANGGSPVATQVNADGKTYAWAWRVSGTSASAATITATFAKGNSKASVSSDVVQVVRVAGVADPPFVGSGTVTSGVTANKAATVELTTPGTGNSEVAFLYVGGDIGTNDPGWATPGISTLSGTFSRSGGADSGYGTIVGYAGQAVGSATTFGGKFQAHDGDAYVGIAFELLAP